MTTALAIRAPRKSASFTVLGPSGEVVKRVGRAPAKRTPPPTDDLPDERLWRSWSYGEMGEPKDWDETAAVQKYTGPVYVSCNAIANRVVKVWRSNWLKATLPSGEEREIERAQILDVLAKPNPIDKTGAALVKRTVIWLGTTGNAYWYIFRDPLGSPRGFWPLFPQLTKVVCTPGDFVVGVNFYPDGLGSQPTFVANEDVVHFKLPNPMDHLYGWSPLRAAAYEMNTADAIRVYESNWFKNQMRPDYVVSVGGLTGTADAVMSGLERVRARFRMHHQGARRYGEPVFLPPGSQIQQIQFSLADSMFLELSDATEERIYRAFGIPAWITKPEGFSTRAAATQAAIEFAENTVEPWADVIYDTVNVCVVNEPANVPRPDGVALEVCHDSAAPTDLEFKNQDARENFKARLIKRDEAREELGWDPVDDGTGDEYYSEPASPSPFGAAGQPMQPGAPVVAEPAAKSFDPEFVEALAAAVAKQLGAHQTKALPPPTIDTTSVPVREITAPDLDTDEKRAEYWAKAIKPQDAHTVRMTAVMRSFFRHESERVVEQMRPEIERLTAKCAGWRRVKVLKLFAEEFRKRGWVGNPVEREDRYERVDLAKMGKDDPGFDVQAERDHLIDAIRPVMRRAGVDAAELQASQLGLAWDIDAPEAHRWLESYYRQTAADTVDTTAETMMAVVRDGVADGKSANEIVSDMREVFRVWGGEDYEQTGELEAYRAARFARTNISTAFGYANQNVLEQAAEEDLVTGKMYLSARDSVVRTPPKSDFDHDIDGEVVAVDQPFSNGLRFIGDPQQPIGNRANCRCAQAAVVARG